MGCSDGGSGVDDADGGEVEGSCAGVISPPRRMFGDSSGDSGAVAPTVEQRSKAIIGVSATCMAPYMWCTMQVCTGAKRMSSDSADSSDGVRTRWPLWTSPKFV